VELVTNVLNDLLASSKHSLRMFTIHDLRKVSANLGEAPETNVSRLLSLTSLVVSLVVLVHLLGVFTTMSVFSFRACGGGRVHQCDGGGYVLH